MADALYHLEDDLFTPTPLARSPWDADTQHGGPPSALIMRAFEATVPDMLVARVTTEILAPIPMTPVRVEAHVVRPGRRVQLLEARLVDRSGTALLLGRAWMTRVRPDPLDLGDAPDAPPPEPPHPHDARAFGHLFAAVDYEDFAGAALETREAEGSAQAPGPAMVWYRHRQPIVAGEEASPAQRLIAIADCANGASWVADPMKTLFINFDLTLYLWRQPRGAWLGMRSTTHWSTEGRAASDSEIFDTHGSIGRSNQGLFIEHRS